MEQAAQRSSIHSRSGVDSEADDSTRALVHDDEDPMGLESEGFTPEEIHAPQAILCVAEESQPRGAIGLVRVKVGGEDPSHDIFIDRQGKGLGYLLGNFGASKSRITAFHL